MKLDNMGLVGIHISLCFCTGANHDERVLVGVRALKCLARGLNSIHGSRNAVNIILLFRAGACSLLFAGGRKAEQLTPNLV